MKFIGRRVSRVVLPLAGAALAAGALGTPSAQAEELPEFSFADCPALPPNHLATGSLCFNAVVVGGRLQVGNLDQEITEPISLTWGSFRKNVPFQPPTVVFGSFKAPKMLVQPGLFGDPIVTAVYAKPEFAGVFDQPPSPTFDLVLGLKVKVINPLLGPNCYLGGNNDPIRLRLTTGTTNPPPPNQPITGTAATIVQTTPIVVRKSTHVDNAFGVPGARGCGLNLGLLNGFVNLVAGTPSPAGTNTTVQNTFIGQKPYTELS